MTMVLGLLLVVLQLVAPLALAEPARGATTEVTAAFDFRLSEMDNPVTIAVLEGDGGTLELTYGPNRGAWAFPVWRLEVSAGPAQPGKLLAICSPERDHDYRVELAYDGRTGLLMIALLDMTAEKELYRGHAYLDALGSIHSAKPGKSQANVQPELIELVSEFVPVGLSWAICQKGDQTMTPLNRVSRGRGDIQLAVHSPEPASGELVLVDGELHGGSEVAAVRVTGELISVDLAERALSVGDHMLRLQYRNGETVWWIGLPRTVKVVSEDIAEGKGAAALGLKGGGGNMGENSGTGGEQSAHVSSWMGRLPQVDISMEKWRQVVVDSVPGRYLGHPDTVLLGDGKTILVVYPLGHGGPTVLRRSSDGGLTWSERWKVPENWAQTANVPTIHRLVGPDETEHLIVMQNPRRQNEEELPGRGDDRLVQSISLDGGKTWTPFAPNGLIGHVAPNTVVQLANGDYLTVFQLHGGVEQSTTSDGGLTWHPQRTIATHHSARLTEPAVLRSPDGGQLAVLIRENTRKYNSMLITSDDDGETWSKPVELPASLTGDRHMPVYGPDGRLLVVFRDMAPGSPTRGDFVGWVGTYADLVARRDGAYRIRLLENKRYTWDTGYAGLELLPDGTFVATTYVPLRQGARPSVVCVRFRLSELDKLVADWRAAEGGEAMK